MTTRIHAIKDINAAHAAKLQAAGITTPDALLEQCATPEGRKAVAAKTDIGESQLLKWVNIADLMRLKGVEPEMSQLLDAAGVGTVTELKDRAPDKLHADLTKVNATKKVASRTPPLQDVQAWISSAQAAQPRVTA
jgi:hypothetical protein